MEQKQGFWIKQLFDVLKELVGKVDKVAGKVEKTQSDFNEADSSNPAYIKNKPAIPTVMVVTGTASDSAFSEGSGQPTLAQASAVIAAGGIVYLKVDNTYEMAIACGATILTKTLTWS